MSGLEPLPTAALRWRCDPKSLGFESTEEVAPIAGVVGQTSAVEALHFGLASEAPGQNVFIRGLTGTGRMTLVRRLLEQLRPPCKSKQDRCYVHNFAAPDRPRLLSLAAGEGRSFRRAMHEFGEFIRDGLKGALNGDALKARREALERRERDLITELTGPFEKALKEAGLALVSVQLGPLPQTAIFPLVEGKPVPPDELEGLVAAGKLTEKEVEGFRERGESFERQLAEVTEQVREVRRLQSRKVHSLLEEAARAMLGTRAQEILARYPGEAVRAYLSEVVDDVAENRLSAPPEELPDPLKIYGVNVVLEHSPDGSCPIIVETTPTMGNLLGTVDREWTPAGPASSDYRMVRAGSILRADGGYLILDVRDLITEGGAWKSLMRTLRTGLLEIVPPDLAGTMWAPNLKPEAIPVKVRVILVGDSSLYYLLDANDPDFSDLFKVLADFDSEIDREPEGVRQYAAVLARIAAEEKLLAFDRTAVAALAE
ncbi:MAG: AAA family ATPase, partial [Planctomycetes bacterium]|nr:AAA family ATPase [Planctomycetota bacterium]